MSNLVCRSFPCKDFVPTERLSPTNDEHLACQALKLPRYISLAWNLNRPFRINTGYDCIVRGGIKYKPIHITNAFDEM